MPDFNSAEYQSSLIKQLSDSLQATASLTESVHTLHYEVKEHYKLLVSLKGEVASMQDRLSGLLKVVQGNGLKDSLTSAIIEIQAKVSSIEQWRKDSYQDKRESRTRNTTMVVLIITSIVSILITTIFVVVPILFKIY